MKVTVLDYPCTFSFTTDVELPPFKGEVVNGFTLGTCDVRDAVLLNNMRELKVPSPCHDYEDYVVEGVQKIGDTELWHLGS